MAPANAFSGQPPEAVLSALETSAEGLSQREAEARLQRWGPNRLPEQKSRTLLAVFAAQFASPFIYLLVAAGAVSVALGHYVDALFILAVLILNASLGAYQEWRAEQRARALQSLIHGTSAVWRDGVLIRLDADLLVPGDVVQVESGERIRADARLLDARGLMVDESLLTGESLAVHKRADTLVPAGAPLGEQVNTLHAGTTVQTGRGRAVITATGVRTEVGRLTVAIQAPPPPPPLVRRMQHFTNQLGVAMLFLLVIFAGLEAERGAGLGGIVVLAIALVVSAIPEGLPVAMTVALSIATRRMGARNVVVRRLPAVEGLGACTVIATDKTGTLTQNRLSVERLWVVEHGEVAPGEAAAQPLLQAGALASEPPSGGMDNWSGDAVDLAFLRSAADAGWDVGSTAEVGERIAYEPELRYAAAFVPDEEEGDWVAYVKGAPETVLGFCGATPDATSQEIASLSAGGYRVIGVASGRVAHAGAADLHDLQLFGFAGLLDPLRPEAEPAVTRAHGAGLRVVMVTGDHPLTALAIARQLGLAEASEEVVTGTDLRVADNEDFDRLSARARVFARTEPLQKLAIVESLQRQGHTVAVTGDGINDAAALRAADIGIAMGGAGTDVARDAADLILTDDNFASIVAGIEEGRIAYDNLRKVIVLLISTGAGEVLLMLLASLSQLPPPLTAVQLLWLNLVTNGMQDVALAFEQGEPDVLQRSPRASHAPIFDRRMIGEVTLAGLTIGLIAFTFYQMALRRGLDYASAQGAVLWVLVWCENVHCFNARSERRSVFRVPLGNNPLLVTAVVATQLLQIAALHLSVLSRLLSLQQLTLRHGMVLSLVALLLLAVMEFYKWIQRRAAPAGV